jgi:hypothetical protein
MSKKPVDKPIRLADNDRPERWRLVGGQLISGVHPTGSCYGPHCCIHNPSDHHMRKWPMRFAHEGNGMERQCPHGYWHPDPDDERARHGLPTRVHCLNCDTIIFSRSRHDFVRCNCEDEQDGIFVDGGSDYFRMGFGKNADYKVLPTEECDGCCNP